MIEFIKKIALKLKAILNAIFPDKKTPEKPQL